MCLPCRWSDKVHQQFDGRSFPCTVGAEKAEYLAPLDLEIQVLEGHDFTGQFSSIRFPELVRLDGCHLEPFTLSLTNTVAAASAPAVVYELV